VVELLVGLALARDILQERRANRLEEPDLVLNPQCRLVRHCQGESTRQIVDSLQ
jgi:hypothetical protein